MTWDEWVGKGKKWWEGVAEREEGPKWAIFWWRNIMWMIPIVFLVHCLFYFEILTLIETDRNKNTCSWILFKNKTINSQYGPDSNTSLATSIHSHMQHHNRIFSIFWNRPSLRFHWQWYGQIVKTENKGGLPSSLVNYAKTIKALNTNISEIVEKILLLIMAVVANS